MDLHLRLWSGRRETRLVTLDVEEFLPHAERRMDSIYLVGLGGDTVGWCYREHGGVQSDLYLAMNDAVAQAESTVPNGRVVTDLPAPIRGVDNWGLFMFLNPGSGA
jgi:hypothetical protein